MRWGFRGPLRGAIAARGPAHHLHLLYGLLGVLSDQHAGRLMLRFLSTDSAHCVHLFLLLAWIIHFYALRCIDPLCNLTLLNRYFEHAVEVGRRHQFRQRGLIVIIFEVLLILG
jgi:hypothetical protein